MSKKIPLRTIQWIFFDIGDVLVNEDRLRYRLFRNLEDTLREQNVPLTFDYLIKAREELILEHQDEAPHYTIAKRYLSPSVYHQWHKRLKELIHTQLMSDFILVPQIRKVVNRLAQTFKLGLIADQPHEVLGFLRKEKLLRLFKVHAISGVVGMNKPKRRIFEWAVNQAGVSFDQCMMIGDRIDRDIHPANALDMTTVQVLWPVEKKGYRPTSIRAEQYLASLKRVRNWQLTPSSPEDRPDALVEDVRRLIPVVEKLSL